LLTHTQGRFIHSQSAKKESSSYEKGELVVVRFVKYLKGFGVTVQLD